MVRQLIKTTYRANVERDGKYWVISVPAIRSMHTQALSKIDAESMTRDAISLLLEVEPNSFDLEFNFLD